MRAAVFGVGGQLGRALARVGKRRDVAIVAFDRAAANITDARAVDTAVREARADVVINAAAYTAVDKAETEFDLARAVNAEGAANVAAAAEALRIPVIHISTDYVFDGSKRGPYVEDDPIAPLGAYGRSKALGEEAVRAANERALILRTAWVYGLEGANFVKTMLRLAAERDVVRVVDDQHGCPTFADDLADGILSIAENADGHAGTYHLAAGGEATWFDFARAIFAEAAHHGLHAPRLDAIATGDFPTLAKRPANSVLDCTKAKRTFAVALPAWPDGLARMLRAHWGRP